MEQTEYFRQSLMRAALVYARYARGLLRLLAAAVVLCPTGAAALEPGDAARDFALRDSSGAVVTLSEIQRGASLTVLEMVNIYCDSCKSMAGELNEIADAYRDRGVRFCAVALANSQQEIAAMSAAWKLEYPVLADPDKITMHLYGAARVPQFFIIDSGGIIRLRENFTRAKKLRKKIDELLQDVPTGPAAGDAAPAFQLIDQFGDTVRVAFTLRNQNTILGFFARDDEPTRACARLLAEYYERDRRTGLRVFAVLPGSFDGSIQNFISESAISFPVLIDRDSTVFRQYAAADPPEIIIINDRGRIMRREHARSADDLRALFAAVTPAADGFDHTERRAEFLTTMLPGVHMFKSFSTGGETLYLGMDADGRMLLTRFVFKDVMCDVCTDVHYAFTLDATGIIRHIALVLPFEVHGAPIDASPFITQFIGRRYDDDFVAGTNVDGISGATLTSKFFIEGLRETVGIVQPLVHDASFSKQFRAEACYVEQAELELALNVQRDRGVPVASLRIEDLAPEMPGGRIPVCPDDGTYFLTEFQGIPRVGCSLHGLDPRSTLIH